MRGIFFECENCKTRTFNEFPIDWMHIPILSIQVGKGCYIEKDRDSYGDGYSGDARYDHFNHLTFCSMGCFLTWFRNKYPKYQNPSQRGI